MENIIKRDLIFRYLKENNLSKSKFCKLCKISPSTLNKILSCKENLKMKSIFKIAKQLNIKIHNLFHS